MKSFFLKYGKLAGSILFAAILIVGALFYKSSVSEAQSATGLKPFGGKITFVKYCCNGLQISIDQSAGKGGEFFYDYTATLYREYNIFFGCGQATVGLARPGAFCLEISSECEGGGYVEGGTIVMIGTGICGGN